MRSPTRRIQIRLILMRHTHQQHITIKERLLSTRINAAEARILPRHTPNFSSGR